MGSIFALKEAVWCAIGIVAGIIIDHLIPAIKFKIQRTKSNKKIEENDKFYYDNFNVEEIHPLAHAAPYYKKENFRLTIPDFEFHISIPEKTHEKLIENNSEFDNAVWEDPDFYFGRKGLEGLYKYLMDLTETDDIIEITELVNGCRNEIGELFLKRSNEPFFNGEKYGIRKINEKRVKTTEEPAVEITTFRTDYYTHRVMAKIYQKLIAQGKIEPPKNIRDVNRLYPFLTSIGMDVLLVINDGSSIVLTKRSEKLFNMEKDKWHLSMNEGISITDIADDRIILDQCVKRGLHEELGINYENHEIRIRYGDLFMLKNPLEVGITGFVNIDSLSIDDLRASYSVAKDSAFESTGDPFTGLKIVDFNEKAIDSLYAETKEDITPACRFTLNMLCFRAISDSSLKGM